MAEQATLARPYAKAAFEYALEHNDLERWSRLLGRASAVVADPRVEPLLTNPRVPAAELVDLLAEAAGDALHEQGRSFLATLADNRRLALLPEIAGMFEVMRADVENVADVRVVSAVELNDAQRERLAGALGKRLKRKVRLQCDVDPALIGGAVVRCGDFVIDGSLRSRLERLAGAI